jgi:hypothetical protein
MIKNLLYILPIALFSMCGDGRMKDEASLAFAPEAASTKLASFANDQSAPAVAVERKLIKTGDITFETPDVKQTKAAVEAICKELNAYISNENQNNFETRIQYNQTIRVPAENFDMLFQRIEADAINVDSKNVNTQDVTEEFIDVEARLKTKKELEARYRELLSQAKTVQDLVSIEGQIANVRSEIESMEGRLNYLKSQVGFSTLTVSYYEVIGTDFGFSSKLIRALRQGWDNLLSFLILTINLWPFLFIVASVFLGIGAWRKRKKNQSAAE